jgi:cell division protein ZipA
VAALAAEEPKVDIKDFILIGGGLLIAAVIAHGFWIAWRARRDPLRLDIVPDIVPQKPDAMAGLRSELPNGGARVINRRGRQPEQVSLELDADAALLLEPLHSDDENHLLPGAQAGESAGRADSRSGPSGDQDDAAREAVPSGRAASAGGPRTVHAATEKRTEPRVEAPADTAAPSGRPAGDDVVGDAARGGIADVIMPEQPILADDPKEPRRWAGRRLPEASPPVDQPKAETRILQSQRQERDSARDRSQAGGRDPGRGSRTDRGRSSGRDAASAAGEPDVQELIVINVVAAQGQRFEGPALVEALRARGLRYGEMNIFHRVEPLTRIIRYSVASVLEPGTFDMAEIEEFRSPGVCFFMQLPGPEQPLETFEDMLAAARDLALQLGGELKDEQRSVMTGQTVEHYRQRIADFCRRAMSMRA